MKKIIFVFTFVSLGFLVFGQGFPRIKEDSVSIPESSKYWNHQPFRVYADTSMEASPCVIMPPTGYTINGTTHYTWDWGQKGSEISLYTDTIMNDVVIIEEKLIRSKSAQLRFSVAPEATFTSTASIGQIIPVNSTSGARTVNPPSGLKAGDIFGVVDSRSTAGSNNITIDFTSAGIKLHGSTSNSVINTNGGSALFMFINSTIGCVVLSK